MVTERPALSFAGLLRQLRAEAKLTQEELAAAAGVSARSVSNLERGINRTAHKDTAVLLAGALGLTGPAGELFVAAARGNVPAAQVLAAAGGAGPRPGAVTGSPYRGLSVFGERDAGWFFGREAAAVALLDRMSRLLAGTGLLVVSGASGAGKSSLLRAGCCRGSGRMGWRPRRGRRCGRVCCSPRPGAATRPPRVAIGDIARNALSSALRAAVARSGRYPRSLSRVAEGNAGWQFVVTEGSLALVFVAPAARIRLWGAVLAPPRIRLSRSHLVPR